jgi:hypothetical protein
MLRLDAGDGGLGVLGHNVAAVQQAAGHVFPFLGVTFHLANG